MKLIYTGETAKRTPSQVLCDTYEELFQKDPKVVHLDADLLRCISMLPLRDKYPQNVIDCGIQEANAVGVAAGLYLAGYKPFVHSFAAFASRRVFDTAFISVAYAKKSVRILGSDPGIMAQSNGGTHMPFEDLGMFRLIPEATVIDITDAAMLRSMMKNTVDRPGLTYIRFPRKGIPDVYEMGSEFTIGKAEVLKEGSDVTIIASGIMTATSLDAQVLLEKEGIHAEVIDVVSIKPLDEETLLKSAVKTGAVVTAENHNILGGLGSAVAELLCENEPMPLKRIGAKDRFGQVGKLDFLRREYKMTAKDIAQAAIEAIGQKNCKDH